MIIRPTDPGRPATSLPLDEAARSVARPRDAAGPRYWSRLRINYLLWFLLVATNVTDVLASKHALANGAVELNPIVARLLEAHGITGLVVFKGVWLLLVLVLVPYIRGWTQSLYVFVSFAYVLLAAYHFYHL